jgi:hypothetical protein
MKYAYLLLLSLLPLTQSYAQQVRSQLDAAYREGSSAKLEQFLRTWQQVSVPVTAAQLAALTPYQQQAYAVFTAFYKPHQVDSLGGSEWGNNLYSQARFLLVQNTLKIKQTDKLYYSDTEIDSIIARPYRTKTGSNQQVPPWIQRVKGKLPDITRRNYGVLGESFFQDGEQQAPLLVDSLLDFRPVIKVPGKHSIYLTPELAATLTAFLGPQYTQLGNRGTMQPVRASKEGQKRQAFLERQLKIWYGHWGGYWQLSSYPLVTAVTFDQDLTYARVSFRMVYEGGEAILKRTNKQWAIVLVQRTWIE